MENKEKAKLQLGLCLQKILRKNKSIADANKLRATKDIGLIVGLRSLESSSGISFPILQLISVGKKNPQHTTVVAICESLGLTLSEFFTYYDEISDMELLNFKNELSKKKQDREKRKGKSKARKSARK